MNKRLLSNSILTLTFFCLLLAGAILTGCNTSKPSETQSYNPSDSVENPAAPPTTDTPEQQATHSLKMTLYFPNSDASGLVPTERTLELNDQEVIKAMFKELASPPAGFEKPLPSGTTLLDATVSPDGIATINLSKEFKSNFGGGSAGELMTIYSIVNTLTTLSNVHSVQFLLEGVKHDSILGHLDTRYPIKRDESIISKS